jgi:diguanylate cyclase (GGDEF)-like protein
VIMIDVDQFKPFNDHYTHQAGDECLKTVSNILKETACRTTDIVTRYQALPLFALK